MGSLFEFNKHSREALQESSWFLICILVQVWRGLAALQGDSAGGVVVSALDARAGLAWVRGPPERFCTRRGDI